jgi:hypothetical protein
MRSEPGATIQMSSTQRRACRLSPGELRRFPVRNDLKLLGLNICCPWCGFVTLVFQGSEGRRVEEDAEGRFTLSSPAPCCFCRRNIDLRRNVAREAGDV